MAEAKSKSKSAQSRLKVIETPFCGELRSKKYYMYNEILTDAEAYHDASGHTWCYLTQIPIGPDGSRAAPEYCTPGRSCYRSALQDPEPWKPIKVTGSPVDPDEEEVEEHENPEV